MSENLKNQVLMCWDKRTRRPSSLKRGHWVVASCKWLVYDSLHINPLLISRELKRTGRQPGFFVPVEKWHELLSTLKVPIWLRKRFTDQAIALVLRGLAGAAAINAAWLDATSPHRINNTRLNGATAGVMNFALAE
jgi:hypothetical protein